MKILKQIVLFIFFMTSFGLVSAQNICELIKTDTGWENTQTQNNAYTTCVSIELNIQTYREQLDPIHFELTEAEGEYVDCINEFDANTCKPYKTLLGTAQDNYNTAVTKRQNEVTKLNTFTEYSEALKCTLNQIEEARDIIQRETTASNAATAALPGLKEAKDEQKDVANKAEDDRKSICRQLGDDSQECKDAITNEELQKSLYNDAKQEYEIYEDIIKDAKDAIKDASDLYDDSKDGICYDEQTDPDSGSTECDDGYTYEEKTDNCCKQIKTCPKGYDLQGDNCIKENELPINPTDETKCIPPKKVTTTTTSSTQVGISCTKDQLLYGQCSLDVYDTLGIRQSDGETSVGIFVQDIVLSATMFIGTIVTIAIVVSGLMFVFGGANPELQSKAKKGLINAIIGLVIVMSSYFIIRLVQFIVKGE